MSEIRKQNTKKKVLGFTLIELLVVIAIIGLLAAVVVVSLNIARAKARNARRMADVAEVVKALELYYSNNSDKYPMSGSVGNTDTPTDIQNLTSFLVPTFLSKISNDPKYLSSNYRYIWGNSGKDYGILIPFSNDGGWDCQVRTAGGLSSWFGSSGNNGNGNNNGNNGNGNGNNGNGNGNGNNGNGNGNGGSNNTTVPVC